MGIANWFFFREPIVWNRQPNSLTVLLTVFCGVAHAQTFSFFFRLQQTWQLGRSVFKVWLYFTRQNDTYATCNLCKKSISSKGGYSTNMQKHLSTQHGMTLQECHVFDACSSAANISASSLTIEGKLLQTLSIVLVPFVSL